jgi:autotransporter-associated beta strand protein
MKPLSRKKLALLGSFIFAACQAVHAQTYFQDSFDTADGPINSGVGSPRQSGTLFDAGGPLEGGGAYYFHSAAPTGRQQPTILSNKLNLDGVTGNDGAGGTSSPATVNIDNMLLRASNAGEGATTNGLDFGTTLVGTHYTVSFSVQVTNTQNVDKLGIKWADTPNAATGAGGEVIFATASKEASVGPVYAGVDAQTRRTNYLPSEGGASIPKTPTTTHNFNIDVDETANPAIVTVYEDSDGTPKKIFAGTATYDAARPGRYLIIFGDGNVGGNTFGTIDSLVVKASTFTPPAVPKVWVGTTHELWDIETTSNWTQNAVSATFSNGDAVVFDATGAQAADIQTAVTPASITVNSANPLRLYSTAVAPGSIAGATAFLQKQGAGNVRSEIANTYAGGTTVVGGSLTATVNSAFGTGGISLTGNTMNFESPAAALDYPNTITGNNQAIFAKLFTKNPDGFDPEVGPGKGTQLTLSGTGDNNGTVATVESNTKLVLAKASSANVSAVGILNTTVDSLTIQSGGSVQLAGTGNNQIDDGSYVSNDGTFDMNGRNETFDILKGSGIVDNTLAATTSELTVGITAATTVPFTWSGNMKNSGGTFNFRKFAAGTMTIDSQQTYTGSTTINGAGPLVLAGDGSINTTSQINLQTANAVLDVSGATGGLALTSPTSLINGLGTFIGNVSTPGKIAPGVAVTPTATLTFNGNLAVSGSYEINVDDRNTSPVTATADATLNAGVITAISVTAGGQVYTTVPTVTISGDGTGATAAAVIAGGVVTAVNVTNGGTGYTTATVTIAAPTSKPVNDQIAVAGDLNISGAALIVLPAVAPTAFPYTIATYTGTRTGTFASVSPGYAADYSVPGEIRLIVAPAGGYSKWAGTNAGGQSPDEDFDNDGMPNGVEYFVGATGSTFTPNPQPASNVVTWPKDPTATDATGVVQTSINLVDWIPAVGVVDNGTSLQYTITGPDKQFTRLKVTIP